MPDRRRLGWLIFAMLLVALPGSADIERRSNRDFKTHAIVEGDVVEGDAYAIPLSTAAVAALGEGGELRLFDASGREIPSLVATSDARTDVIERPASIFNRAWQADGTQTLSVELTSRAVDPVDEFVVGIADDEYHLLTRVEGSDDGESWGILGDGLRLIRHSVASEKIDYVHDVLRIPTARFRYYRFTFTPRVPAASEVAPLEIESVKVRDRIERGAALDVPVVLAAFEDPQDRDARHDYWTLDLEHPGLGVDRVTLTIPSGEYARPASLWEWDEARGRRGRRLAHSVLFHYGSDVQTRLSGFSTDADRLVLMIDQGDDAPVEATAAQASRPLQQLRFLAPPSLTLPLAIYFDPDEARAPRYDLARRLRENETSSFTGLSHADLAGNPAYREPEAPRSERIPYLLYVLVVPLVVGLGWYVARSIRRGLPDDG